MEKRNILRQIPKKEVKEKKEKQDKTFDEIEVFKTDKSHDLDILPVAVEETPKVVEKVVDTPEQVPVKKKKVFPRIDCECGTNIGVNMVHIHKKQKKHVAWLESQKEKTTSENVEDEKVEISIPQESTTKKQEVIKEKPQQINHQPFQIDYDKIINGVSQNYINYKLQKQEHKKKQTSSDDYKTKYENLLKEQEKNKKQSQVNSYLLHQNQAFGRRRNGFFN